MRVSDIMTQDVVSIAPDRSVKQAAEIMLKERISGLPVIDANSALVGIVTEGDLLRRVEIGTEKPRPRWLEFVVGIGPLAKEYARTHGRKVSEIMTSTVATVTEDETVTRAVEIMERRRVKRLPVVRGNRVVGIIARSNLLRALAASTPPTIGGIDDSRIRAEIESELARQPWKAIQSNIIVRNGCVDLWGAITDERYRDAIRVTAENVAGVREVRDHLVYVPISNVAF